MTGETDLPPGWALVHLGDLMEPSRPRVQPNASSNLPFVGMDSIEPNSLRLGRLYNFADMKSGAGYFEPGDVLYGRMRPYLNKVHRARIYGACSTEFIVFPQSQAIDPDFLTYLLHNRNFVVFASKRSSGDRPRVDISDLGPFAFGLPPLFEQRRIVEKIEELFSLIEAGEQALTRAQTLLERYRQSVLNAAVTGELTTGWRERHRGEIETGDALLERILKARREAWEKAELAKMHARGKPPTDDRWKQRYKAPQPPDLTDPPRIPSEWQRVSCDALSFHLTSGSRAWTPFYNKGDATFVMAQNVRPGRYDTTFRQRVDPPPNDQETGRTRVQKGDLLVTIVGANTGNLCQFSLDRQDHYVCQSVALIRPYSETYGRYLNFYFQAEYGGQRQYRRYIYGAGRPHLSFDQLRQTIVALPSEKEAERILERTEEPLSDIGKISSDLIQKSGYSASLRQSILAAAFSGKLVPQDPADELASTLLERIRAERAEGAAKPRPRPGNRRRKLAAQLP